MSTTITTLIENNADGAGVLAHEHGISFLIEHNGTLVLFDTGQSDQFLDNAAALGVDLSRVGHVVLSHGHYDHTDGFPFLVERIGTSFELHVHPAIFDRKYGLKGDTMKFIGMSWDRAWLEERGITITPVEGNGHEIVPGVHIVTGFLRDNEYETDNPRFAVRRTPDGDLEIDDFRDEVSIVLETDPGLVVIVGCSHPGIMNMLDTVRQRFPQPIYAVLGGTHLVEAAGRRLERAYAYLTDGTIARLGLSHCTGDDAMNAFQSRYDGFYKNVTGSVFRAG
jgi:7,8-dihydropterin-6-yl-methyl-4-(beta-D-ribofuranosyl)aminobenzene 5'-phosphate synthase